MSEDLEINPRASLSDLTLPEIKESDCGEVALRKMSRFIPSQLEPYVLHNEDEIRQQLFRPKELQKGQQLFRPKELQKAEFQQISIRAVVICRVSTCGPLQDQRSPINQAMGLLQIQYRRKDLAIIGVIMDFYKNGGYAQGRMFQDFLVKMLKEAAFNRSGFSPIFDCILVSDLSRMSRCCKEIIELADMCQFLRIKIFDHSMNVDYSLTENRDALVAKGIKAETQISDMGFNIASAKLNGFIRDKVLAGHHFGFEKVTYKDASKTRVMRREYKRKEDEIRIILDAWQAFAETGRISFVQKNLEEKYKRKFTKTFLHGILYTTKYYGLVYRVPNERIRDPKTGKVTKRRILLSNQYMCNYEKVDDPEHFRYYIKELDIIPEELFHKVREIIDRKRRRIKSSPSQKSPAHAPSGENGKSGYTGLCVCGKCGTFYIMGAKGFLYCANCRKKICGQKHGIHSTWLDQHLPELIEQFLTLDMPKFDQAYRQNSSKWINLIDPEINELKMEIQKKDQSFVAMCHDVTENVGLAKEQLNNLAQREAKEIEKLEKKIISLENQVKFIKTENIYSVEKAKKWIQDLKILYKSEDACRLKEKLDSLISHIIFKEKPGLTQNSFVIEGRAVFKQSGLARFFIAPVEGVDFYYLNALTEQPGTIIQLCSVNAEIYVNFEIFVELGLGARAKKGDLTQTRYSWKVLTTKESSFSGDQPRPIEGSASYFPPRTTLPAFENEKPSQDQHD